jgi:D-alanyl-lipoteichoic acid acyltransferase DltB (MBOAT superfamily)
MFLCGLWHGASWTFVVWGGLFGIGISLERIIKSFLKFKSNSISRSIGGIITFLFICFCWIFFRAENFGQAFEVLGQIFTSFNTGIILQVVSGYKEVFLIILSGYAIHFLPVRFDSEIEKFMVRSPVALNAVYLFIIIWIVIQLKTVQLQPFIYFNF